MNVNDYISRAAPNGEVTLPSGEFEGPLVINKPLRLRGKNTTIWAKKSPVVQITSGSVTIEDIRAEITEGSVEEAAVTSIVACSAKNVEIWGRVTGFGTEDGFFDIPRTIELGRFPANIENTYKLEVNVPVKTDIVCEIREVKFEPTVLQAGRNELTIKVGGISEQTFMYGEVLFKSQFTRRVYLTGKPDSAAEQAVLKPIYTAPQRSMEQAATPAPAPAVTPTSSPAASSAAQTPPQAPGKVSEAAIEVAAQAIREMMRTSAPENTGSNKSASANVGANAGVIPAPAPAPAPASDKPAENAVTDVISMVGRQISAPLDPNLPPLDMTRGQRVGLTQYLGDKFEVWFTANTPRNMEIDPYVFLLESGDKASGDEGLIFFGNACSKNGEVRYFAEDGHIAIDLSKVQPQIQKISLAYSIYDGGAAKNFRTVGSPRVSLRSGSERVTFTVDGLTEEATIIALEFYLYKGEWKISAVGAGYKDGLAKMCNRYGIEVES